MTWRQGAVDAQDVNDFTLKNGTLEAVAGVARGSVLGFGTPMQFIDRYGRWNKGTWGLLVTDQEVVLGKKGTLGGPRVAFRAPIENFERYGVGLQGGHGPLFEYACAMSDGSSIAFLFRTSDAAETIAEVVNRAVGGARDPDMDELNRALKQSQAQPPGDVGEELTAPEIIVEARRAREQFDRGDYDSLWARRVELGYGVGDDGVPQADRFWLDAAPAIAALRLGLKDHPMVAMCCGVAQSGHDRSDPEQVEAVALFNRLYHGS